MNQVPTDFSICPKEAQLLWGKSKRTVMYAVWQDKVKARQALNCNQWFISYQSCVLLWGKPIDQNALVELDTCLNG